MHNSRCFPVEDGNCCFLVVARHDNRYFLCIHVGSPSYVCRFNGTCIYQDIHNKKILSFREEECNLPQPFCRAFTKKNVEKKVGFLHNAGWNGRIKQIDIVRDSNKKYKYRYRGGSFTG